MFGGKKFLGNGPYYCPEGLSWKDLKTMVEEMRSRFYVRIVKTKINHHRIPLNPNTHEVWLYIRRK
jgi:hypothetical protein